MSTNTDTSYNGWKNYETWAVKLWIDSEESSSDYWRERTSEIVADTKEAHSAYSRFTGREIFTHRERAHLKLADDLKDTHEQALPELQGFAADLLNGAMSDVNWAEIADSLLESHGGWDE